MTKCETYRPFEAAEYLKSEEDMANYLDAMMEESNGNPRMIAVALGDIARAEGMTQIAKETGLARENLYKALSAYGNPEFSTIMKVMKALGLTFHAGVTRPIRKIRKRRQHDGEPVTA